MDDCGTSESSCNDDGLGLDTGSGDTGLGLDTLSSLNQVFSAGESALIIIDGFSGVGNYVLNIDGC